MVEFPRRAVDLATSSKPQQRVDCIERKVLIKHKLLNKPMIDGPASLFFLLDVLGGLYQQREDLNSTIPPD